MPETETVKKLERYSQTDGIRRAFRRRRERVGAFAAWNTTTPQEVTISRDPEKAAETIEVTALLLADRIGRDNKRLGYFGVRLKLLEPSTDGTPPVFNPLELDAEAIASGKIRPETTVVSVVAFENLIAKEAANHSASLTASGI